jgi:hypothetical protein
MSTNFHTAILSSPKQPANASTVNSPLGELDAAIGLQGGGADATNNYIYAHFQDALARWSNDPSYHGVYTDVILAVNVIWPDGSGGLYTAVTVDGTWLEPTQWTLTHTDSGKTLTASGLVRNAAGQITTHMSYNIA